MFGFNLCQWLSINEYLHDDSPVGVLTIPSPPANEISCTEIYIAFEGQLKLL
jgi:hypothetical protein